MALNEKICYAKCRKQAHYAKCHYAECHNAECRGAIECHAAKEKQTCSCFWAQPKFINFLIQRQKMSQKI
jgi:hypothetical protein